MGRRGGGSPARTLDGTPMRYKCAVAVNAQVSGLDHREGDLSARECKRSVRSSRRVLHGVGERSQAVLFIVRIRLSWDRVREVAFSVDSGSGGPLR